MSYYCHVAFACFSSSSPLLCRPVSLWRKARWWTIETNACHGFSFSNLCLIFQSLQWWFKNLHPPFMCMAVTLNLTHDFNPRSLNIPFKTVQAYWRTSVSCLWFEEVCICVLGRVSHYWCVHKICKYLHTLREWHVNKDIFVCRY